jgi:protein-L-isoaspartate(D-aspartate) O-methyltransferase
MQAGNLRQARVELGMRVLEIGSGGPNATMLAHLAAVILDGRTTAVVRIRSSPTTAARRAGRPRPAISKP